MKRFLALIYIFLLTAALASCAFLSGRAPVGEGPVTTRGKSDPPSPDDTTESHNDSELAYVYRDQNETDLPGYHVIGLGKCTSKDIVVPRLYGMRAVTCISANAFAYKDIVSVSVEKSVKRIEEKAFQNCKSLTTVSLVKGIENIGQRAFSGCSSLTSITLPYSITAIGEYTFSMCTSLEEITFGERALPLEIGEGAFQMTKIKSITIPKNTTARGSTTFQGCTNLEEVIIEDPSTTLLNPYAFGGCVSLKRITFAGTCDEWRKVIASFKNDSTSWCADFPNVEVVCTDGTLCYGENANKGELAFKLSQDGKEYGVTGLGTMTATDIVIPSTYKSLPVTWISNLAFQSSDITSVTIPSSVHTISANAFAYCYFLEKVTLSNRLRIIDDSAFLKCMSLTEINLPETLTSIGVSALNGCTSLSEVALPASLTSIGSYAFNKCESLTEVTLPASLTSMGTSVFSECTSLQSVTFSDGIKIDSIPEKTFYRCTSLHYLSIPKDAPIKSVGEYAFYYCTQIETLVLPDTVETINKWAFSHMDSLTELHIKSGVTSFHNQALFVPEKLNTVYYGGTTQMWNERFSSLGIHFDILPQEIKVICSDGEIKYNS